jgi:hypothetical protein
MFARRGAAVLAVLVMAGSVTACTGPGRPGVPARLALADLSAGLPAATPEEMTQFVAFASASTGQLAVVKHHLRSVTSGPGLEPNVDPMEAISRGQTLSIRPVGGSWSDVRLPGARPMNVWTYRNGFLLKKYPVSYVTTTDGKAFNEFQMPTAAYFGSDQFGAVAVRQDPLTSAWQVGTTGDNGTWRWSALKASFGPLRNDALCMSEHRIGLLAANDRFVSFDRPTSAAPVAGPVAVRALPGPASQCAATDKRFAVAGSRSGTAELLVADGDHPFAATRLDPVSGLLWFSALTATDDGAFVVSGSFRAARSPDLQTVLWRVPSHESNTRDPSASLNGRLVDVDEAIAIAVVGDAVLLAGNSGDSAVVTDGRQDRSDPVLTTLVPLLQEHGRELTARDLHTATTTGWVQSRVGTPESDESTFVVPYGTGEGALIDDSVSPPVRYLFGSGRREAGAPSVAEVWRSTGDGWTAVPLAVTGGDVASELRSATVTPTGIVFAGSVGGSTDPRPMTVMLARDGSSRSLVLGDKVTGSMTRIRSDHRGTLFGIVAGTSPDAKLYRSADGVAWEQLPVTSTSRAGDVSLSDLMVSDSTVMAVGIVENGSVAKPASAWVSSDSGTSFEEKLLGDTVILPRAGRTPTGFRVLVPGTGTRVWSTRQSNEFTSGDADPVLSDTATLNRRNGYISLERAGSPSVALFKTGDTSLGDRPYSVMQSANGDAFGIFQERTTTRISFYHAKTGAVEDVRSVGLPPRRRNNASSVVKLVSASGTQAATVAYQTRDNGTGEFNDAFHREVWVRANGSAWSLLPLQGTFDFAWQYLDSLLVMETPPGRPQSLFTLKDGVKRQAFELPENAIFFDSDAHGAVAVSRSPDTLTWSLRVHGPSSTWLTVPVDGRVAQSDIGAMCLSDSYIGFVFLNGQFAKVRRPSGTASDATAWSIANPLLDPGASLLRCAMTGERSLVAGSVVVGHIANFDVLSTSVTVDQGFGSFAPVGFLSKLEDSVSVVDAVGAADGSFYLALSFENLAERGNVIVWKTSDGNTEDLVGMHAFAQEGGLEMANDIVEVDGRLTVAGEAADGAVLWSGPQLVPSASLPVPVPVPVTVAAPVTVTVPARVPVPVTDTVPNAVAAPVTVTVPARVPVPVTDTVPNAVAKLTPTMPL